MINFIWHFKKTKRSNLAFQNVINIQNKLKNDSYKQEQHEI